MGYYRLIISFYAFWTFSAFFVYFDFFKKFFWKFLISFENFETLNFFLCMHENLLNLLKFYEKCKIFKLKPMASCFWSLGLKWGKQNKTRKTNFTVPRSAKLCKLFALKNCEDICYFLEILSQNSLLPSDCNPTKNMLYAEMGAYVLQGVS